MPTPDLKTCRFCRQSNYDYNHPNVNSAWIRYGVRHSAHLACLVKADGGTERLFRELPTWRLEQLPYHEVKALGIDEALRAELMRRTLATAKGQA